MNIIIITLTLPVMISFFIIFFVIFSDRQTTCSNCSQMPNAVRSHQPNSVLFMIISTAHFKFKNTKKQNDRRALSQIKHCGQSDPRMPINVANLGACTARFFTKAWLTQSGFYSICYSRLD